MVGVNITTAGTPLLNTTSPLLTVPKVQEKPPEAAPPSFNVAKCIALLALKAALDPSVLKAKNINCEGRQIQPIVTHINGDEKGIKRVLVAFRAGGSSLGLAEIDYANGEANYVYYDRVKNPDAYMTYARKYGPEKAFNYIWARLELEEGADVKTVRLPSRAAALAATTPVKKKAAEEGLFALF